VTGFLHRLSAALVAPAPRAARPAGRSFASPAAAALLCSPEHATGVGGALGLLMARERRAGCALVLHYARDTGGGLGRRAPATIGARRLAASLAARNQEARATGRLVVSRLPEDPAEATVVAMRATGAAGDAPTVLVVATARPGGLDELLAQQDVLVVASPRGDAGDALADLALAGVSDIRVPGSRVDVPTGGWPLAVASAGVGVTPSLRRSLAAAVAA
jgi:hypothetical protein